MPRRSTPKPEIDKRVFKVCMLVRLIPVEGCSPRKPFNKLSRMFPPGEVELRPFRSPSLGECSAAYFRSLDDAARCMATLQGIVEVVDSTTSPVYNSPHVNAGRRIR
jgi:hypothetical protein